MEENNIEIKETITVVKNTNQQQIVGAIVLAGFLIAGAILLKGSGPAPVAQNPSNNAAAVLTAITPVGAQDRTLGNPQAKVTLVLYEDFQCPFCGAVSGLLPANASIIQSLQQRDPTWSPFMTGVMDYVKSGTVQFVYRDWAFLGPESIKSAEAARCAGDQGKFWEYHDYLYGHQNGENQGGFADPKLKSFAQTLGLDTALFNQCLDGNKYAQAVADSKAEGTKSGISGTPKGFIVVKGKTVATIDGAESFVTVKQKIDAALK
jgi:protein-disulfide isomerase